MHIITFLISLLLSPSQALASRVTLLDAPKFAARQRADEQLRSRLDLPTAIYFEWATPHFGLGLDALNPVHHCDSLNTPLVQYYLAPDQREAFSAGAGYPFPAYRFATGLLLADLRNCCVPPTVTRLLISEMKRRSDEWDRKKGYALK